MGAKIGHKVSWKTRIKISKANKGQIPWNKGIYPKKRTCVICKTDFLVTINDSRTKKTCSQKCRYKFVSILFSQKKAQRCIICKKQFLIVRSRKNAKFCSKQCYVKSMQGQTRPKEWYKSRLGKIPWNKGLKGVYSVNAREKNGQWKGGIYKTNRAIRSSPIHKKWSREVKKRDNYTCQKCGQIGGKLESNHIKSFANYPKFRFELSNGETLCIFCHKGYIQAV